MYFLLSFLSFNVASAIAPLATASALEGGSFLNHQEKLSIIHDRLTRPNGLILSPQVGHLIEELQAVLDKDRTHAVDHFLRYNDHEIQELMEDKNDAFFISLTSNRFRDHSFDSRLAPLIFEYIQAKRFRPCLCDHLPSIIRND